MRQVEIKILDCDISIDILSYQEDEIIWEVTGSEVDGSLERVTDILIKEHYLDEAEEKIVEAYEKIKTLLRVRIVY